ncbi:hypothetical protein, partial [Holospora elegans]|uniref:hypothetical protein n=1 Tax=Holospora elegans TaxID=431043 RepID=UPI000A03693D
CYGAHDWGRTNAIGDLISKYNCNWVDIWLTKGGTSWVQQILLPNLLKKSGSVMDNATFHKGKAMQKMQVVVCFICLLILLILILLRKNEPKPNI